MSEYNSLTSPELSPSASMGDVHMADDASMQQEAALSSSSNMGGVKVADDESLQQQKYQGRELARKSLDPQQLYTLYPDLAAADQKAKGTSDAASVMLNLSYRLDKPLEEVRQNFQMLKSGYAQAQGWDASSPDSVLKGKFNEQYQQEDTQTQAISSLQSRAIKDASSLAGKGMSPNPIAAFSEWDKEAGEAFKGYSEAQKIKLFNSVYLPVQKELSSPEGQAAHQLMDALSKNKEAAGITEMGADAASSAMSQGKEAKAQPDKIDPVQFLKGMPEQKQNKVLSLVAQLMATQQPEMGNGMKVTGGLAQAFAQGFASYNDINHLDDLVDAEKRLKAAQTPEDARKAQDDIEHLKLSKKIKQIDQQANSVTPDLKGIPAFAYETARGVAAMPGMLAPALVPVLGEFAFYKQAQAQDSLRFLENNPGMSAEEAKSRTTIASAAYGITMGRLTGIFGAASPGLLGFLKHTAQSTLVMQTAEAERIIGRELQSHIDPDFNPNENYGTEWLELLKSTPSSFVTLAAFGGMVKLIKRGEAPDANSAAELEQKASNPRLLQYLGFSKATSERIATLPEGQRSAEIAGEWENRTDEQKQDGVELAQQDTRQSNEILADPNAPKLEQTPDGQFVVTAKNGEETHSATFSTEEGAQAGYEVALEHHLEASKPTEDGNDWTTATEEKEGGLTNTQKDANVSQDEVEQRAKVENTASDAEASLAIRTLNLSLASENKPQRLNVSSPEELSKLSVDPEYQLADKLAGIFGKRVVLYSGNKLDPNGITSRELGVNDYIFLKTDRARPHLLTMGHELWHHLEGDVPTLAKSLRSELAPLIQKWGEMNGKYESYRYKPERFFDEHVADFLGDSFHDPAFLNDLKKKNPEAFADFVTKALDWLNDVLDKLKGWTMGGTDHMRDIESARDMLAEGLHKYVSRDDSPIGARDSYQWWKEEQKSFGERQKFTDDHIIAYLNENRIKSTGGAEYDGKPKLPPAHSTKIYGGNESIDQAHQALVDLGYISEDSTIDNLWNHIAKASESAIKQTKAEKAEVARQREEVKADKELADLRENNPVEYRKRLAEMEPAEQKRNERKQALERANRYNREDRNNFQNARGNDERENEKTFSLANPDVQAYLELTNVPEEKRDQAGEAFGQVAKASTTPYEGRDLSAPGGVDRDELRQIREEQAAAYRGLLKGDVEAVKNAIEKGVPLSKLIAAYAKGDPVPFSIQGAIINSPADLAAHNLAHRTPFFESLKVAVLDNSNQVIHSEIVSIGSLNESIAHPREIMRGIERGKQAAGDMGRKIQGWMLMHNHPSGDPWPSEADRKLTRRLESVASMMQVPMLDHVITNGETYFSFHQSGLMSGGIKPDAKIKPKLQTIPKPESPKEGAMADWEATPAGEAPRVDRSSVVANIRATLQTADPGMLHVLNLNTRHGLISVDRHPLDATPGEILKQSSKHGTYAIALSFPESAPSGEALDPTDSLDAWRPFVRKMTEASTLYQLPLVDAVTKDFSWREAGLLEEPGKYEAGPSAAREFPDAENGNKVAPALSFKDQARITADKVLSAARDLPADSDFKREVLKWSARSQGSTNEIERAQKGIEQAIPDKARRDGITNWIEAGGDKSLLRERAAATTDAKLKAGYEAAVNLTPEDIALANKVKQTFSVLETRAKKYGIDMGHIENYVPHIFEQEPQPPSGTSPKRLSEFFKFSQTRVFDSYFEGEQITDKEGKPAPYKAQTKDIAKLLGAYMNDMNNAINSRMFVEKLSKAKASDGMPLVSPRGGGTVTTGEHGEPQTHLVYPDMAQEGTEKYRTIDQPALHDWTFAGKDDLGANILVKGDLAVHPEVARHLENALGSSAISRWMQTKTENPFLNGGKWVADKAIKGQSLVKGTMLSFSPFHQVQEAIHALGHRVNPFADIPQIDLRDPKQADAAAHGLMIAHDRLSQSLFMEGVGTNNSNLVTIGLRKIGWGLTTAAADKVDAYQHWLFSQYIPGLKLKTYEHILERNLERYKGDIESGTASEWQVKVLSAKQSNAAYGHLNYTEMGHNPTIRHAMQLALLAPDFLEARSRFVGQALKGAAGGKVGSEQLQALAFLAATQFVAATIQKVLTNGDPEFDHPFEMRVGNKYYGVRSVPEDIYKLIGNPTGFIGGRISPIFGRFVQEGIFGVNYRGEHTTAGDAITDILTGMVPMPMQALTRQWTASNQANPISWWEQILASTGLQIHRYSPITKIYPLAKEWLKENHPEDQAARGTYPVSKFQQLRYACEDNDVEKIGHEVERLKKEFGMTRPKLASAFKSSVNHPFTGSTKHDADMAATFDEDQKEMYHAAIERRKVILQRFMSAGY